jgi:hypothetical protein
MPTSCQAPTGTADYPEPVNRAAAEGRIKLELLTADSQPGDTVRGRLLLSPDLDGIPDISVALVFETAGSCDGEREVLRQTQVRRPDGERAVDFAVEGPRWPPTYRGRLFTGRWHLEVQAGSEVARGELVVHAPPGPAHLQVVDHQEARQARPIARRLRRLAMLGLVEAACVAVILAGLSRGENYWVAGLVLGLLLLPPVIGTALGLASARAAGELAVSVLPTDAGLAVRARPGDASRVSSVTATLVVRERAQRRAGLDHAEFHEESLHERSVTLAPDGPGEFTGVVPVPAYPEAPFTMSHSTAQVGWSLHLRAAITGAPDQERGVALVARPRAGAQPPPAWTTG